jgi:hypothetical protein
MTRKDFELIAEVLAHFHREYPVGPVREVVSEMAVMFRRRLAFVNKNFDQERFMAAALNRPAPKKKRAARVDRGLEFFFAKGFDLTKRVPGDRSMVNVKCSQCEALSINGVPTHERGCPNARRGEYGGDMQDGDDE